jgi:hypothetical protein
MSNTEQLARRAFWKANITGDRLLKKSYPNGCTLEEAIAFFAALPAEEIAKCEIIG